LESDDNLHLEIGHVLFIDIVGYSKLLNEGQKERLNQLIEIVLATTPVREATDEQLVTLPTGDGIALVFHHSAEEPARCALEIAEALQKHPELPVRMGIHSGPVNKVTDVSGRTNLAGAGINMAQRVMDCGEAGHILSPSTSPMIWCNTGNGRRVCVTWVNARSSMASGSIWSISTPSRSATPRFRRNFSRLPRTFGLPDNG